MLKKAANYSLQFLPLVLRLAKLQVSPTVVYNRLQRLGLVRRLLFDCYDTLHAESIDGVVWNVTEALKNWESEEKEEAI